MTMITNKYFRNTTAVLASVITVFASLLTSCTNDDDASSSPVKDEITFASPVTVGITRAVPGEMTNPYDKTEKFKVFGKMYQGSYTGWDNAILGKGSTKNPNFLAEGEDAVYKDIYKGWTTTNKVHRWINDYNYTFGAYSPADAANATYAADGLTVNDFVPLALGSQYDLLYSKRVYGINRNSMVSNVYNGVPITFYHALSSIIIKIGVHPEQIKEMIDKGTPLKPGDFKIKSIKLLNVINQGTFKQNITEQISGNNVTYTEAPEWNLTTTKKNYPLLDKTANPVNIPLIGDGTNELSDAVLPLTDTSLGGFSAILIPQDLTGVTLEIIWTESGNEATTEWTTSTIDLSKYDWLMGYRYVYTIAFHKDRIYFAPNADTMGSGSGGGIVIE